MIKKDVCETFAIKFSIRYDIVESSDWANEIIENAQNGIVWTKTMKEQQRIKQIKSWNADRKERFRVWRQNNPISNKERKELSRRMKLNNPMKILKTNSGSFKKGQKPLITSERNIKISLSKQGILNPNYGKKEIAERLNVRKSCSRCGKITTLGNLKRWHEENCRHAVTLE